MAVTTDIIASWRSPRAAIRRHLGREASESFAFVLLLSFLILTLVGQWPQTAREAFVAQEPSAAPRLLGRALAVLATIPLWYALAALSHVIARAFGGRGTWYGARLALFWALFAATPGTLVYGLIVALAGKGPAIAFAGVLVFGGFLYLWGMMLAEAEAGKAP